jgi:hypothetical protein
MGQLPASSLANTTSDAVTPFAPRISTVRSTAGLGTSAEDAVQADYRLWDSWYVRSEARERGETVITKQYASAFFGTGG